MGSAKSNGYLDHRIVVDGACSASRRKDLLQTLRGDLRESITQTFNGLGDHEDVIVACRACEAASVRMQFLPAESDRYN